MIFVSFSKNDANLYGYFSIFSYITVTKDTTTGGYKPFVIMKTKKQISSSLVMNIAFPDVLVKTHHGNVHLRSLIRDKRIIVFTNPSEMIPLREEERKGLIQSLKKLKKLNFHLIGFNRNSFDEHLRSVNWINSYLSDDLVFPVFYQPTNEITSCLEKNYGEKIRVKNPVFFLNKNGCTQLVLEGIRKGADPLKPIVEQASRLVLSEQPLQQNRSPRDS